jgi:hypothetical protein
VSKKKPSKTLIDIRQCKLPNYEEIVKVVASLNLKYKRGKGRITVRDRDIRDILSPLGKAGDKYVPHYVKDLSPRQIKIFLDSLWKGDGCFQRGRYENYTTKSPRLADDVQELLLKIDLVGTVGKRQYWNGIEQAYNTMYVVSPSHSSFLPIVKKKPEQVRYKGMVYDLTVPNSTLYIRRNGKAIWSGNCYGDPSTLPLNFIPQKPVSNTIQECNGLGMGFTLFKMDIFKDPKLRRPWFKTHQGYDPQSGGASAYTQDLYFFENIRKNGYKVASDNRVLVGHYSLADDIMW